MNDNRIYETELTNAITQLLIAVNEWEKAYLLVSPVNGNVAFMQLWERSQYVIADETLLLSFQNMIPYIKEKHWFLCRAQVK